MGPEFEEARKQLEGLIGSKVELTITSGLHKGTYVSSLEELDNGSIGVSHPTFKGAFLPIARGTELVMKIETPNCIYQAVVAGLRGVFNVTIPLLWLKLVSALEKVQRRMFVRVPTSIKAEAFFLGGIGELSEDGSWPPKEWFSVRISDISLGGIGITIKQDLVPYCVENGRYLLSIKIDNVTLFIVGKIVKILIKREGVIEIGFAYESLPVSVEKTMVGYIRQQELMARG